MESPPAIPSKRATLAYDLALISLVFGLASLPFADLYFCGITAIAFGWVACRQIRKARPSRKHRILAIAGITLGVFSVLVAIDHRFVPNRAVAKAKLVTSKAHAAALETAVISFHVEFGSLPVETACVMTDRADGVHLLTRLLGSGTGPSMRYPKFLALKEGKNRKNGLIHTNDGQLEGLFDSWGSPYMVELDSDCDGKLRFTLGTKTIELTDRIVAVHSPGPDGKHGTRDDVTTW